MFLKLQYLILITYSLYLKCKKYSILPFGFDGDHLRYQHTCTWDAVAYLNIIKLIVRKDL